MDSDNRIGNLVLLAIQFATVAASLSVLPFMSVYVEQLSPVGEVALWVAVAAAAPAVLAVVATPVWGALLTQVGCRVALVISCLTISASLCLQALAASAPSFALARALQGMAGIGIIILVAAGASGNSGSIFTRLQQSLALGCIVGPLLGGFAFEHDSLAIALMGQAGLIGVLGILAFCFHRPGMQEADKDRSETPQTTGGERLIVIAAACVVAGAFGFIPFFAAWAMSRYTDLSVGLIATLHSAGWAVAIVSLPLWERFIRAKREVHAMRCAAFGAFASLLLLLIAPTIVILAVFRFAHSAFQAAVQPLLFSYLGRSSTRLSSLSFGRTTSTLGQIVGPGVCGLAVFAGGPHAALIAATVLTFVGFGLLYCLSGRRFDHDR